MKRTIASIALVAAFLVAALVIFSQREGALSSRWNDEVSQRIQKLDDYAVQSANYDRWFDTQHVQLFATHYSTFSGFDGEAYLAEIFRATADLAAAEGFTEQADKLRELHGSMLYQPD